MLVANVMRVDPPRRKLSGSGYSNNILEAVADKKSHSKWHVPLLAKIFYLQMETNVDGKV